jgi:hypothetical protein
VLQQETKEEGPSEFKFKARPAPKAPTAGILAAGLKERPQGKVTQAVAPHFASDDRIRERHDKKAQSTSVYA